MQRGKDLVCWCALKRCHGDVLLQLANEEKQQSVTIEITFKERRALLIALKSKSYCVHTGTGELTIEGFPYTFKAVKEPTVYTRSSYIDAIRGMKPGGHGPGSDF